ncbi:MAG: hypothetical protein IJB20_08760 [Clostridia bacterium]|nr:hypothetical protein [Clostridia bacterium]
MKKIISVLFISLAICLVLISVCSAGEPRGTSYPTATWNIATAGTYPFSGSTDNQTLYTNYRFSGCDSYTITITNDADHAQKVKVRRASDGKEFESFSVPAGESNYVYTFDAGYIWYLEFYVNPIIPKGCDISGTISSAD